MTGSTDAGYWDNFLKSGTHGGLAKVAINLLSIPCSSASVERSFSLLKRVHTNSRASLIQNTIESIMLVKWHVLFQAKEEAAMKDQMIDLSSGHNEEAGNVIENMFAEDAE